MKIVMPEGAKMIIDKLFAFGYEAFIVGGCVRDALLGKVANDFDITTSAMPEVVKEIFEKTVDTGVEHGTVSVILDDGVYEVTTYRIDGDYADNRHPVSVSFTANIADDLARRDFTVNAMAYNERSGLVDEFGGIADLEGCIIRAVGDPYKRFSEDALRILRAVRFSSVLGFSIEENTRAAAIKLSKNLQSVSGERILVELKKLLGGKGAYGVLNENKKIIEAVIPEISDAVLPQKRIFDTLSYDERLFLIFAVTTGEDGFLRLTSRLKFDNKLKLRGLTVLRSLTLRDDMSDAKIGEFLIGKNDSDALSAARICDAALITRGMENRIQRFFEKGTPRSVKELDFNGGDAALLGYTGKECGALLHEILFLCASGTLENENSKIMFYIRNSKNK